MAAVKTPAAVPATKRAPAAKAKAPAPAPATEAPAKERISASDEEITALVGGVLTPRKVKGDANQEALTSRSENDRPKGRPVGVSTGLPIMLCWGYVFQQNEKAPTNKKMTDADIVEFMRSEYPGRDANVWNNVQYCRRLYNMGRFTKNQIPKVQSQRFDEKGAVLISTRGRNLKAPAAAPAAVAKKTPAVAKAPVAKTPAPVAKRPVKVPV